jgi:small subunit ribosomal protein S20
MARHKSALKATRHGEQRRLINKANKTRVKSTIKDSRIALKSGAPEGRQDVLPQLYSVLDRMGRRGVIHPNKAARIKSRLTRSSAKASTKA